MAQGIKVEISRWSHCLVGAKGKESRIGGCVICIQIGECVICTEISGCVSCTEMGGCIICTDIYSRGVQKCWLVLGDVTLVPTNQPKC